MGGGRWEGGWSEIDFTRCAETLALQVVMMHRWNWESCRLLPPVINLLSLLPSLSGVVGGREGGREGGSQGRRQEYRFPIISWFILDCVGVCVFSGAGPRGVASRRPLPPVRPVVKHRCWRRRAVIGPRDYDRHAPNGRGGNRFIFVYLRWVFMEAWGRYKQVSPGSRG